MPNAPSPPALSLYDIASWQFSDLPAIREEKNQGDLKRNHQPNFIAAIPSLQRGAVWRPGQVEMLWDSILRGFPIGALVVCQKFEGQHHHSGKYGGGWGEQDVTHYLLDGQQRCNAIALGFLDAHKLIDGQQPAASLWIDLQPEIPTNSTRRFVLRMLTSAHPWGYTLDDEARFIGVAAVRSALNAHQKTMDKKDDSALHRKRPPLTESWPHVSRHPVPFSWLIKAAFSKQEENSFWEEVLRSLEQSGRQSNKWAVQAYEIIQKHICGSGCSPRLSDLFHALQRACNFRLVALETPQVVLLAGDSREEALPADKEGIHNVEHLFQRLNSAGTVLRGEELLFSMVKAYWPSIETSFGKIRDRNGNLFLPMPGWRLATLGIRAAKMSLSDKPAFEPPLNIPQVRKLAVSKDGENEHLKAYLGISHQQSHDGLPQDADLHLNLRQVDEWLLFGEDNKAGMPPVLRSALARSKPDIYLLLLQMAQMHRKNSQISRSAELTKRILGVTTLLHWFGTDSGTAARYVLGLINEKGLEPETFRGIFAPNVSGVLHVLSPDEVADTHLTAFDHLGEDILRDWTFWRSLIENRKDPIERARAEKELWPFIHTLIHCKPLLLYAQRDFMNKAFAGYDPSCVDIWDGHDRPWDYDHILPSAVLYRKHNQTFKSVCSHWLNTIGNLRAWPLEANRSKSDEGANKCITTEEERAASLLNDQKECDAFSIREWDIGKVEKVAPFINAARARLLRIYRGWFEGLGIECLINGKE